MEPEPTLHAHLFVPVMNEAGPVSTTDLEAAVAAVPRKSGLVIQWVKAALEAGLIERADDLEERDVRGRPTGPRLYRLTMAGAEQVDDFFRLTLKDVTFLDRLQLLGGGRDADELSSGQSDPSGYVQLWMESAYARGLIQHAERREPIKAAITSLGEEVLAAG